MKTIADMTLLFVDDEPDLLSSLRRFLRKEPYQKIFAGSAQEALDILATQPVDILVSDLRMPNMDGMALMSRVKAGFPEVIRLILSASRDVEQIIDAINTGEVYRFISKPLDPEPFKAILRDVIAYHLLLRERKEMTVAIQSHMLQPPPPPKLCGATLAALVIPAGELNGDFADYFVYDEKHVDILVGDVMGKGLQSALVAASLKHLFGKVLAESNCRITPQTVCPQNLHHDIAGTAQVVADVHSRCIDNLLGLEMFASLIYARLDLAAARLGLIDCGHLPVIHFQAERGECAFLKGENAALGIVPHQTYQVHNAALSPGDVLLFYSDGVTEAASDTGELYGHQRLAELLRLNCSRSPDDLVQEIREQVGAYSGMTRFDDDFTCVAVRIDAE